MRTDERVQTIHPDPRDHKPPQLPSCTNVPLDERTETSDNLRRWAWRRNAGLATQEGTP